MGKVFIVNGQRGHVCGSQCVCKTERENDMRLHDNSEVPAAPDFGEYVRNQRREKQGTTAPRTEGERPVAPIDFGDFIRNKRKVA